jgi:hypothetical protein
MALVNSAPFPAARGEFQLDAVLATNPLRGTAGSGPRLPGAAWTETVAMPDAAAAVLCELVDRAALRDAIEHPWETRPGLVNLADHAVNLGMAVLRRK